ncbi:hypothetical protein KMW28_25855 [Flammeovirga yaeyamensis]|uniref:Outer membrane protein beta-barrel domain-containing protein n=1 Tax=Flammeovirga yaeyamensis TaxID=367791 RepID=A0AAX1NAT4_9BACT|nr:hypothetical protein [Flammeovirga yaeyamensis]MBB3699275.1 hypothetical protein [Flammeovirga yaeyamensis]NMF35462.1 hypothetical protein [Flammeovirga yaeyamensis]QWG04322.1 hypothetical protein KMW28_25855 [Flammeovirga yaeyamensis]
MRKLLLLLSFLFVLLNSYGQDYSKTNKFAIGVSGGSNGLGIDVSRNLNEHFNGSLSFNYLKIDNFSQVVTYDSQSLKGTANVDMRNIDLRIEYLPFKGSGFKIVAGLAYMFSNSVQLISSYTEPITLGVRTLTPDDIGEIRFESEWNQLSPYLGIGLGRAVPKKRIGFGLDMGTYYLGNPNIKFYGTELFTDMSSQEQKMESNMKDYTWFPLLRLRLSVRLN